MPAGDRYNVRQQLSALCPLLLSGSNRRENDDLGLFAVRDYSESKNHKQLTIFRKPPFPFRKKLEIQTFRFETVLRWMKGLRVVFNFEKA